MHRIDKTEYDTSADADVLAGSALDPIPADGYLRVYAASSVNTATIAIDPSIHSSPTGPVAQSVQLRAAAEIRAYDPHWEVQVSKGEKVVIAIAGTTGTYQTWASFVTRKH